MVVENVNTKNITYKRKPEKETDGQICALTCSYFATTLLLTSIGTSK